MTHKVLVTAFSPYGNHRQVGTVVVETEATSAHLENGIHAALDRIADHIRAKWGTPASEIRGFDLLFTLSPVYSGVRVSEAVEAYLGDG